MKKLLLLGLLLFLVPTANAQTVYLNDTFTRTTVAPWTKYESSGTTVAVVSNQLRITVPADGMGLANYPTTFSIQNFTYEFDYIHRPNNFFEAGWRDPYAKFISVRFDTSSGVIHIANSSFILDYISSSYPFTTYDFATIPYAFSWATDSIHHIKFDKRGSTFQLWIDGAKIYELTDPRFNINWEDSNLGNWHSSGDYARFDNAVVIGTPAKIIPNVKITFLPSDVVNAGTKVEVMCYVEGVSGVPLTLYYGGVPNEVSNPYFFTPINGTHYFECCSNETDVYGATCNGNILRVLEAPTVTTTYSPIPLVNETEWQSAGFGWATVFFTPIFLSTLVMAIVSGIAGAIGGAPVGGGVMVVMMMIFTITGIYPAWVGIVVIIISAFIIAKTLPQLVGK